MRLLTLTLLSLLFLVGRSMAAGDDESSARPARKAMVSRVDELLAERLAAAGVEAAAPADDAEFLRRVYLDLAGVIPRVSEARAFLRDERADKRAKLIDQLLASPGHATHLANTWRNIMLPGGVEAEQINNAVGVQNWLRAQFAENVRYDRMVSDLLVATNASDTGPALFYTSLELQPEKLAAATARIFLGLQIECAQCHNHPFDRWKQEDFWGYAAFFARLKQPRPERRMVQVRLEDVGTGEVKLPGTETVVPPKFPSGPSPAADESGTRREQLSIWMASRDNPYLARAAVNRVWAHLFGRGLVEPVDDLAPHNPASHPQLFDELTGYFVQSGFDLRELYRTLANTRAYQRSSQFAGDQEPPPELVAKMPIKPLTPDQFFDSLSRLLPKTALPTMPNGRTGSGLLDPRRQAFVAKLQSPSRSAIDYQAGVLQALTLLNGAEVFAASDNDQSSVLGALTAPLFNDDQRVETLFLATLSRPPTLDERTKFTSYLSSRPETDRNKALSDILWALLNSAEFGLNH